MVSALAALAALVVVTLTWVAMHRLVWRPYAVGKAFRQQGIGGPAYRFLVGNSEESKAMVLATAKEVLEVGCHDMVRRVLPQHQAWTASHGKVFLWWMGHKPAVCVGDHDMAKEVLGNKAGVYHKMDPGPVVRALLGNSIIFAEGGDWARRYRVLHRAFTMDRLKTMVKTMAACAGEMADKWEGRVDDVGQQFMELTADVISHTAFGSSYGRGKAVFEAQRELQHMAMAAINDMRIVHEYLPTRTNLRRWRLSRTVRTELMAIIRDRQQQQQRSLCGYGDDLLGLMLEANNEGGQLSMEDIIDECKTFFFAGHDTSTHLLTWAMFLLGTHPEWQRKLREEVLRENCPDGGGDALNKLKLMTMVLYETLRLYGPVVLLARTATADTELGTHRLRIPKGTHITIPIAMTHRDRQVWGADADDFNPERFRDGVCKAAKHPSAMLAFSVGPRACLGQDFAMLEAKATLAIILRRFHFTVAPDYVHAPAQLITLQPLYGLPILLSTYT